MTAPVTSDERARWVRRGLTLNYLTIAYNALEAVASLIVGVLAGSIALLGFGADSVIELAASGAAQWRLRADVDVVRRAPVERVTRRAIAWSFILLAIYVSAESVKALWFREPPDRSVAGIVVLGLSAMIMPLLARAKRHVAQAMNSGALASEAKQTSLCAYLSFIALAGVAVNAALGWWWADPVAALAMVPIILKEGLEGIRAKTTDDVCC